MAQGIYVDTASGWFSDRTVRYLASGKPALVQDTGFSRNYPVGDGLIAFRSPDEAIAGDRRRVLRNYQRHARAARALAEEYFDAAKVLSRFLGELGSPGVSTARGRLRILVSGMIAAVPHQGGATWRCSSSTSWVSDV